MKEIRLEEVEKECQLPIPTQGKEENESRKDTKSVDASKYREDSFEY